MAEQDSEKTEAPTPRRLHEARQEGNIARSMDLTAACSLLAATLLLGALGQGLMAGLRQSMQMMLDGSLALNPTRADDVDRTAFSAARLVLVSAGPLVLALTAVALVATIMQVGFIFTGKPLEWNLSKLSPLRGLSQLFGTRATARLGMSMAKLGAITAVAVITIVQDMPMILAMGQLDVAPMFIAACELVYTLALRLAILLLALAIIDYAYQRWQHDRDLRMTKEEIKEELKRMDGDPLIKQRRARVARQLALQRVGQAVPRADVVVTNPTHFAVALRYDNQTMKAPKVVAKGADFLALRIRQLAAVHGVPMVERRELAQALYKSVEVGQEVPPQYYSAVAEILAYVYRLSGRRTA